MSGNLRLKGATSGSSQLSAPDSGTDQQFTFPATGGELVTTPVSGQFAGYQQGVWTPYATSAADFYNSGVCSYSAQSGAFVRIGYQVTATFWMRAAEDSWEYVSPINENSDFYVGLLPYTIDTRYPSGSTLTYIMRANNLQYRGYAQQQADLPVIVFTKFATNADTYSDQNVSFNEIFGRLGSGLQFQVTYQTDDNSWAPQHGATVS